MIYRLLSRDIERKQQTYKDITAGTPNELVTADYTENYSGSVGTAKLQIGNTFQIIYPIAGNATWSVDYAIPLNRLTTPLVMAWVLGGYSIDGAKPAVRTDYQAGTVITGGGVDIPAYSASYVAKATCTWSKTTLNIGVNGTGPTGPGVFGTGYIFVKYAIYYDSTGVSQYGF